MLGFGEIFLVNSNDSLIAGSGGGQLSNQENTIRGRGRVNVPVINNGTLFADWPNADLVFNGSVSLPPVGSSVLAIRLDGLNSSQSSRLVFTNSIPTNGTLKIVAGDNFDANVGQSTEVITSAGFQGPGFSLLNFSMAQSLTQGFEFDVINNPTSIQVEVDDIYLRGDVNTDGFLSLLDVAPFVDLLVNGEVQREADVNGDGSVTLLDVGPFVELLTGG